MNFLANNPRVISKRDGITLEALGYIIHSIHSLARRGRGEGGASDGNLMAATENPTLNFNLEAVKVHRESNSIQKCESRGYKRLMYASTCRHV